MVVWQVYDKCVAMGDGFCDYMQMHTSIRVSYRFFGWEEEVYCNVNIIILMLILSFVIMLILLWQVWQNTILNFKISGGNSGPPTLYETLNVNINNQMSEGIVLYCYIFGAGMQLSVLSYLKVTLVQMLLKLNETEQICSTLVTRNC